MCSVIGGIYMKASDLEYIKNHFSDTKNKDIASYLNISVSTVIRTAKQYNLKKSKRFLNKLRMELMQAKKDSYERNKKEYYPTIIQQNIIVGSILGDGSLALYGRSKNAYFREHGSEKQKEYRQWKCNQLSSLNFKLDDSGKLHSPSHPIYTNLYNSFYTSEGIKYLSKQSVTLLNHPIGLACLYMDDGSLVIDSSSGLNKKYIFPRILIYTLCFSQKENQILIDHIKQTFDIPFKLKKRPDGKNYILELNRRNHILDFLELVKPYVSQIPCMSYKIDLNKRMEKTKQKLSRHCMDISIGNQVIKASNYSLKEEEILISMKRQGSTDAEIADKCNRSYWSVVDKIRRLRKAGKI
jgi:transposase